MLNPTDVIMELQEMRDEGFLSDALLRSAVRSIAGSDDRYNWAGAFLVKKGGEAIWLHNYIGAAAGYAEIQVGEGIGGVAVAELGNRNVPDVGALDGYTPCGPDIRSEIFVLIRAGDEVFGGIDLGSEAEGAFGDADEAALQAISDKLAEQIASERR